MKRFALAVGMGLGLGLATLAAPANAAILAWDIEYSGWWEEDGGGSISGKFVADHKNAQDGIVSVDEMTSWLWNWSGNDVVPAFSFSSGDAGATTDFNPSFYVDGRLNQPLDGDGLDQGTFTSGSGNEVLDLEYLFAISYVDNVESFSAGNLDSTLGRISVSDPVAVPEPDSILGLITLVGISAVTLKRRKQKAQRISILNCADD